MCNSRWAFCLLGLACCNLAGCAAQAWGVRSSSPSKLRTIAAVGDKPLPIVSGEPGSSLRGETEPLELPPATGTRLSGRVFDGGGRPVSNAKVRLVVDGAPGGRIKYATTDRSGAFTLRGLRPGSSYTLVAEYQGEAGMMSGRADVRAPDTDVRISLGSMGGGSPPRRTPIRPARARSAPALDPGGGASAGTGAETEPEPEAGGVGGLRLDDDAGGVPAEDREPTAEEAATVPPRTGLRPAARLAADQSPAPIRAGWNVRRRPTAEEAGGPPEPRAASLNNASRPHSSASPDPGRQFDDDGENPLPPALEPDEADPATRGGPVEAAPALSRTGEPPAAPRSPRRQRSVGTVARDSPLQEMARTRQPDIGEPQPMPEDVLNSGRAGRPSSPAVASTGDRGRDRDGEDGLGSEAATRPGQRLRRSAPTARARPVSSRPGAAVDDDSFNLPDSHEGRPSPPATPRRPTWRELSIGPNKVPLDESLRKTSVDLPSSDPTVVMRAGVIGDGQDAGAAPATTTTATTTAPSGRLRGFTRLRTPVTPTAHSPSGESLCRVDPHDRRIIDFQLPDLDGSMISFHDFDADLILLDFWGSWCGECRKSISYLRELPTRYSGKRLQVIGIACEKGASLPERRATAAQAVQRLGINYPVLLSTMDRSCPLQQALKVQFYPTLILVDRDGRILHVEQGATDTTLARTDRVLASALRSAETRLD